MFTLTSSMRTSIDHIIQRLSSQYSSIEDLNFQRACIREACNLPKLLREYLAEISSNVLADGYFVISGFETDDDQIGDTPSHWDAAWDNPPYLREEIYQCLISISIGTLFGWRTQENGRYLRHIVPIKKDENEQLGGGSKIPLFWHTEEAFHPGRADYLSLMCYRNTEQVLTLFANINNLNLDDKTKKILHQERFFIEPDKSHTPQQNISDHWQMQNTQFTKIQKMLSHPKKYPVLYGTNAHPMMLVDQAFMYVEDGDMEAFNALDKFHRELDKNAIQICLKPGEIVIIDNLSTAHARVSYIPNYGPKQRWMRRVNIRNGRRAFLDYAEYLNDTIME